MTEKELESVCIDITTCSDRQIRIGSVYQSPNTDVSKLLEYVEMVNIQTQSKPNHKLIMGMDQNLDLLKSEEHTNT